MYNCLIRTYKKGPSILNPYQYWTTISSWILWLYRWLYHSNRVGAEEGREVGRGSRGSATTCKTCSERPVTSIWCVQNVISNGMELPPISNIGEWWYLFGTGRSHIHFFPPKYLLQRSVQHVPLQFHSKSYLSWGYSYQKPCWFCTNQYFHVRGMHIVHFFNAA